MALLLHRIAHASSYMQQLHTTGTAAAATSKPSHHALSLTHIVCWLHLVQVYEVG
jgi:hypothetical protein